MSQPLPIPMKNAIQIAWDCLERTGEFGDPEIAGRVFLLRLKLWFEGRAVPLFPLEKAIGAYKKRNSQVALCPV